MRHPSIARRILMTLLALVAFAVSGAAAFAVAADLNTAALLREDVTIKTLSEASISLIGLTRDEARSRVVTGVVAPLMRPLTVRCEEGPLPALDPTDPALAGIVAVDVERLLDDAFRAQARTPFAERVLQWLSGETGAQEIDAEEYCSVDSAKASEWAARIATQIDRPPVSAVRTVEGNRLRITPSVTGVRTDQETASKRVVAALLGTDRTIDVPTAAIEPTTTMEAFPRTIVVDRSERRLYLYAFDKLDRTYRVAVGTPGFPTPLGEFKIVLKRYRPTWVNPGSDWAVTMPPFIPPGPGNPLGTRALNLNAPGIRIHGTENVGSVGTAASHGCMRMLRSNIEELYELVDVGTAVYIVR